MASVSDIRRRIKSVKNIQQITKAMKMVAAARLRRAQEKADLGRPYTEKITAVLRSLASSGAEVSHPLLEVREVKRVAFLVITSDKGLAGAYNSNVIKEALPTIKEHATNSGMICVGRKSRDYFKARGYHIETDFVGFSERPTYNDAIKVAQKTAQLYENGTYDEVYLVYTKFISAINQKPTMVKLLPLSAPESTESQHKTDYIFEPDATEVLNHLVPQYMNTLIYTALVEAAASELGARMTAMSSATDNANDLIAKLTLNYNKVRQANITREISEIVGGAEALK